MQFSPSLRGKFPGVPQSGGPKQGWGGKISHFLGLSVNISKTVADMAKVTISIDTKLDDLG